MYCAILQYLLQYLLYPICIRVSGPTRIKSGQHLEVLYLWMLPYIPSLVDMNMLVIVLQSTACHPEFITEYPETSKEQS